MSTSPAGFDRAANAARMRFLRMGFSLAEARFARIP